MTQENIIELNELYKQFNILNQDKKTIKQRNIFTPLQQFKCKIKTDKVQHGWMLKKELQQINGKNSKKKMKLPFNPLIKCTLNILSDEIILISPIMIRGHVNHINNYGQVWITSDLQIDAIEE